MATAIHMEGMVVDMAAATVVTGVRTEAMGAEAMVEDTAGMAEAMVVMAEV